MTIPLLILRLGLGITFALTGILILKDDDKWAHMVPGWFSKYVPSVRSFMIGTALFDLAVGAWLLSGYVVGLAALVAAIHLFAVLLATSRHAFHETYRDVGLLFMAASLAVYYLL
jgi:uncharacterized membrane protein YphA (DoxX/SURF4 family)